MGCYVSRQAGKVSSDSWPSYRDFCAERIYGLGAFSCTLSLTTGVGASCRCRVILCEWASSGFSVGWARLVPTQ